MREAWKSTFQFINHISKLSIFEDGKLLDSQDVSHFKKIAYVAHDFICVKAWNIYRHKYMEMHRRRGKRVQAKQHTSYLRAKFSEDGVKQDSNEKTQEGGVATRFFCCIFFPRKKIYTWIKVERITLKDTVVQLVFLLDRQWRHTKNIEVTSHCHI